MNRSEFLIFSQNFIRKVDKDDSNQNQVELT